MPRLLALSATLLLLALPSTGCGVYVHIPTPEPPAWPIRTLEDHRDAARPTALVRRRALNDAGEPLKGLDSLREELKGVPEESGLFARVQQQEGFEGFIAEADYTLDFSIDDDVEAGWYTGLGLIPGIPLVGGWSWTVECAVLDRRRELLGVVEVQREGFLVASIALLPLNILFTALPGEWLGLDLVAIANDQRRMVDGMLKEALFRADQRFRFTAQAEPSVEGAYPRRD